MADAIKTWAVQEAKAHFSEFLDASLSEGPQLVTRRGKAAAVLVSAEQWPALLAPRRTGQLLIDALQASPHRDIDLAPARPPAPVRDVAL